jgi:hypothetical protein
MSCRGQNAQEIGRLAGELCDKISLSVTDLHTVETKINDALTAHKDAIRGLGVRTRRPPAAVQVEGAPIAIEAANFGSERSADANAGNTDLAPEQAMEECS